ncbi:arrestin domain-containing protein 3 [Anabrus simplex]|uniref:arrestin domain-containing protein 3 n=1 Tax=Anabrus simplex TaxID=316456 RepID=UPI0035A35414
MIVQQFQIFFDNPHATYYAGQMVTGKLTAKILLPTRIRGIELNFHGEAKVEWEKTKQHRNAEGNIETVSIPHSANELYFENSFYILGGPACDMLLQAGDHMYNFSMQLPTILPSSFEGRYGSVRYSLQASLICLGQNNHHAKVYFTILTELDLNQVVGVRDPVQVVKDKFLCCCCCKSGPITAVVSMPASGFVPGQQIPVTVEVDNVTNKTLSSVMCSLQKVVVFTTVRPSKESRVDTEKVCQLVLGGVKPNDSSVWQERMILPVLPPSVLQHCNIIDINYCLVVEVRVPGLHHNLSVSIPITVGTVPLRSYWPPNLPTAPPSVPPHANLPPPSYEECIFRPGGGSDDRHNASANSAFMPRYPTYHF